MSEIEVHVGRLRKIDKLDNTTVEEWCKEYCEQNGYEHLRGFYDTWEECFKQVESENFVIANNNIYRIIEDKEFSDGEDIFEAHTNELGQIQYCLSYYNGGCCFKKAIETALERMGKS